MIGKYAADKAGKKAVLQRQSGTSWKTVDKTEIDKNGAVRLRRPGRRPPARCVYRIDGPGAASTPVSTATWGTDADFATTSPASVST